ncbi:PREDICTED: uncharacterized protein LOC107100103 isoform X1 [Cyprinodon variegatus]|uniref:uncharacterized protein LOC107100103 isoform X1 n=2 Tax=Cyprinodon variegatus TaxID=28743 RepID=UPI0007427F08|nr:PREDICTED: uncharacterized protein LOC107100103 isoform X1 [Cyprinodon variegatus]
MSYMKNIKEMLNIPTGPRNVADSENSGLTDSQVFFGSQFWHEQSQGMSQDTSLSSKNSQQSSQDGCDPADILSRYTSKPLLLGDLKDKMITSGLLYKYEEDMKKAKEKNDSEQFAKESQHVRETLINIQQLLSGVEKNTTVCQTIFEKCDSFASLLKNSFESLQTNSSQMFEIVVDKLSSQMGVMKELEDKLQKNGEATAQLEAQLKSLKNSLESLGELLNTLVSKSSAKPSVAIDSAAQTSPVLEPSMHDNLLNSQTKVTEAPKAPNNLNCQAETSSKDYSIGWKRLSRRSQKRKKRPLVLSRRGNQSVPDENTQPVNQGKKQQKISGSLLQPRDQNIQAIEQNLSSGSSTSVKRGSTSNTGAGYFVNMLSSWSQDSNISEWSAATESILQRLSGYSKMSPVEQGEIWQLFEPDVDF